MRRRTYFPAVLLLAVGVLANGCSSIDDDAADTSASVVGDAPQAILTLRLKSWAAEMKKLAENDYDVAGVDLDANEVDVVVTAAERARIVRQGFVIVREKSLAEEAGAEGYSPPAAIEKLVKDYAERYPALASAVSIGKSNQDRDIWALRIATTAAHDPKKPVILFNGTHHARELMTAEVPLDTIDTLLGGYGTDAKVTHWVDANEIWVLPMLNVDGNNQVWTGDSMWRKNARGCPATGTCRSGSGVDINRNYPYGWGSCNGSSSSAGADDYRGPSAGSEPETQAMMRLVAETRPVFDISYHSYSELVLYPYGCKGKRAEAIFQDLGAKMAARLPADRGTGNYRHGTPWELLYSADGGDMDWMYNTFSVVAFAIEVNGSQQGFRPSYATWRTKTTTKLRGAWQLLLDRLDESAIRGVVHGAAGDATVEVSSGGVTTTRALNPDGSFHIVLTPGAYHVKVTSRGTTRELDARVDAKRVDLDIEL